MKRARRAVASSVACLEMVSPVTPPTAALTAPTVPMPVTMLPSSAVTGRPYAGTLLAALPSGLIAPPAPSH